jgi:hypothetical protein
MNTFAILAASLEGNRTARCIRGTGRRLHAHPPDPSVGAPAWLRHRANDPGTVGRRAAGGAGSLYPALQRLSKKAWVTSKWGMTDQNQRAKFYRLTNEGKAQLLREESRWAELVKAIARVMRTLAPTANRKRRCLTSVHGSQDPRRGFRPTAGQDRCAVVPTDRSTRPVLAPVQPTGSPRRARNGPSSPSSVHRQ